MRDVILRRGVREAILEEERKLLHRQVSIVAGLAAPTRMIFRSASQISFVAASSVGKWPRVLMILRTRVLTFSSGCQTHKVRDRPGV